MPIAKKGDEVYASGLLKKVVGGPAVLTEGSVTPTEAERRWLMMVLMAPYRVHLGLRSDYRKRLTERLNDLLKDIRVDPVNIVEFINDRGAWEQNPEYSKVIVALDMFFIRFPEHPEAKLRICSISARYKDCAALA